MKKITRILSLLLICTLFIGISTADAQYYGRKKKKKKKKPAKTEQVDKETTKNEKTDDYFDESGGFKHKLWYGGGFNINFSGNGVISAFNLGITPMVGYKITDRFSLGPRVGIQYNYFKGIGIDNRTHKVEPISYSLGAFTRYKLLDFLFVHGEFEHENTESFFVDNASRFDVVDGEVNTFRESRQNAYLGLGYTSGSIFAYEIYLLYNFLEPVDSQSLPFDIRIGFTYKF